MARRGESWPNTRDGFGKPWSAANMMEIYLWQVSERAEDVTLSRSERRSAKVLEREFKLVLAKLRAKQKG